MQLENLLEDRYVLEREDLFEDTALDRTLWIPHHLPQWSSRAQSAAHWEAGGGALHLLIDAGQQPWCPEFDGTTRVSSLQTGVFAGETGSPIGQHRFHPDAVVREPQENIRLYTPQFGVFALRAKAIDDPDCMVALWMIGYEDRPERSAEICICEIFGRNVSETSAAIGMGLHPFSDPAISDDFEEIKLPIDATEFHDYAVEWTADRVTFFVDGRSIRTVDQSPHYPMQFMLGIYEFGDPGSSTRPYPKRFAIDSFRAYRAR